MDRNAVAVVSFKSQPCVATREGGVDRNRSNAEIPSGEVVATREGGVDRNKVNRRNKPSDYVSPPARVAWIET